MCTDVHFLLYVCACESLILMLEIIFGCSPTIFISADPLSQIQILQLWLLFLAILLWGSTVSAFGVEVQAAAILDLFAVAVIKE